MNICPSCNARYPSPPGYQWTNVALCPLCSKTKTANPEMRQIRTDYGGHEKYRTKVKDELKAKLSKRIK